jgi:hypothetical protein
MKELKDIANYIQKGKMWEAFASEERAVVLLSRRNRQGRHRVS